MRRCGNITCGDASQQFVGIYFLGEKIVMIMDRSHSQRRRFSEFACALLAVVLAIGVFLPALAAPGDLDPGFGLISSGLNYTDAFTLQGADRIHALTLQPDGAVVVAGESETHFAVARYDANGLLDTTNFGAPFGVVTTTIVMSSTANAVAIQGDGKIVVAGSASDGVRDYFAVARYNADGSLDTAGFNAPLGYITSTLSAGNDVATALVLQSDGKLVVAGYTANQFVVARYTTAGALDIAGFNPPNGYRTLPIGASDDAHAVGLQSDGKIIVAGHADTGTSDDFAVARFTTAGGLDTTFNGGFGYITTDFPTDRIDLAQALAIQPDDKIVVAGYSNGGSTDDFAVARYTTNGTLDTTFGVSGRRTTNINTDDQAFGVAIQPTGRIVLAGTSIHNTSNENLTLVRYTSGGALDTTFGVSGHVTTDVGGVLGGGNNTADFLEAVVVQSDNKIVAAGYTDHPLATGDENFVIARYQSPNTAPVVSAVNKNTSEEITATFAAADFTAHFTDTDGDTMVKVKVASLPLSGTLALSNTNVITGQEVTTAQLAQLTYQPNQDFDGIDAFVWNGTDGLDYAAVSATVTVTVAAVNDAPVNTVPTPVTVDEDAYSTGNAFSVNDVDAGAANNFQVTLSALHGSLALTTTTNLTLTAGSNGSKSMTFQGAIADINAALADVGYGPDANFNGTDLITFGTNDTGNTGSGGPLQDSDEVSVAVNPLNDAPVLDPIGNKTGDETTLITFGANATDIDGSDTLVYSLLPGAPAAATIDAATGIFTWTPGEADGQGDYPITVQVADNGVPVLTDAETLTITVNEINNAPVLDPIGDQVGDEDALVTFDANATDSDGIDILDYSLGAGAPAGATIDPATGGLRVDTRRSR
ncbi:MAG: putative Ig domain-containing protein [Anaerolineales bacterium]|nr:putative Ig domain-containing protein [Anaerolineales bacterium]